MTLKTKFYKAGATSPALQLKVISSSTRQPVDFTGATVTLDMYRVEDDGSFVQIISEGACTAVDGVLNYAWQATDLLDSGGHVAVFNVDFGAGVLERYPTRGWVNITVESL